MTTFAEARPDLAKYYKPELNNEKLMSDFAKTSGKKIVLCCDVCGTHKTISSISNYTNPWRINQAFICNYCTSLGACSPELIKEWNFEKNKLTPFDYKNACGKKVWWKCEKGHEWEATIEKRSRRGRGCPSCNVSHGEKEISNFLHENKIKFITQHFVKINNVKRFFDIYIPEEKLFVEIHGAQHFEQVNFYDNNFEKQQKIDAEKQAYAETHGIYIMVDYREHNPELALERFIDALAELA